MKGRGQGSSAGPWSGGHDNSSFGSCASSLALHTDEAMSASSRMVQEVDEATSESSWTSLAKVRGRDWWSVDLEGDMEKLEAVRGSGLKATPWNPKGRWATSQIA